MLDFLEISERRDKLGYLEIYPSFNIVKTSDIMIRGGDFYAIWDEESGTWSTDENVAISLIDREVDRYKRDKKDISPDFIKTMHLRNGDTKLIDKFHHYCREQMRDTYVNLDETLIFSNHEASKQDFSSKRLPYPLEKGSYEAFDSLIGTLYSPEERHKIEWAIGSIVNGSSKTLQKFMVLYGSAGTGKSTVLNIIEQLFSGYYSVFDAKALGSSKNSFALEPFKGNPLVAIQHDGDLSRIEDNTRLNSLVSHELMTVNEKFKSAYANSFKAFLFMGTNKPVKITDGKSGLLRRLIDVKPSGNKLTFEEYNRLKHQVQFELGAIAYHCKEVFEADPNYYDNYIPTSMIEASNDFYNFVLDNYDVFEKEEFVTRKMAWKLYTDYNEKANVPYPLALRAFGEELKNYFKEFKDRMVTEDGSRIRSVYKNFRTDIFMNEPLNKSSKNKKNTDTWLSFTKKESVLDDICKNLPAQYATSEGIPRYKWSSVKTKLSDIDTSKLHYVKDLMHIICIDFDLKDDNGEKSLEKNIEAASKWPPTYAELSKSQKGIHLHYLYKGDLDKLKPLFDKDIEVKVYKDGCALRRQLTLCNDLDISTISSGLPLKGEKMVKTDIITTERGIIKTINRCLNKDIEELISTKQNVDFIYKILQDAYESGIHYDVTSLEEQIIAFAASSTHQSTYCLKKTGEMKFKSDDISDTNQIANAPFAFFDIEVVPNLLLVVWKYAGDSPMVRMFNPKPHEIEELCRYNLIGFNNLSYDNHILWARMLGYGNDRLYDISKRIISGDRSAQFRESKNISYTDIFDFAKEKKSLKKYEIQIGMHHQEFGMDWDKPLPEDKWDLLAEYCENDVRATEAVFEYLKADFTARKVLADVADMTPNDSTNSLTTKIIFGNDRHPQSQFNYRDMGKESSDDDNFVIKEDGTLFTNIGDPEYTKFDKKGRPVFPGYSYEFGKSTYRGEVVGEGGYVYAEPGMYTDVALLDIASMHPSTIIAEQLFGPVYTPRFQEIRDGRIAVKHKDFESAKGMLDGKLSKYLTDKSQCDDLANALKIAINSVYGLTAAKFDNPFHDPRNVDNIVAKRGALFMVNLKHEVQNRGFTVAHIKTDSIKIPNATKEIIEFVTDYGKMYGYDFEHEATYDRMCLVNDAVYIAKYHDISSCEKLYGVEYLSKDNSRCKKNKEHPSEWTATGTQFQIPYVFKTLFSKEEIVFSDLCETKSVTTALYLDMNEKCEDVTEYERCKDLRIKKEKGKRLTRSEIYILDLYSNLTDDELDAAISKGHNYQFIGKVGLFTPIKSFNGGGILVREKDGKYHSANGASGYRWMESEMVTSLGLESQVDYSYYESLVDGAIKEISKYGDFDWFVNNVGTPPWTAPDGPDNDLPWYTDNEKMFAVR